MKAIRKVADFVSLVMGLFFGSLYGLLLKLYWPAIFLIALIFFISYPEAEWLGLFWGIGLVLVCACIISAAVTILILLGVASIRCPG